MEHFEDHRSGWCINDGAADDLVHCLVIRGIRWIVQQADAAAVCGTGEEGHTKRFGVGNLLKSADEVCALEILLKSAGFHNTPFTNSTFDS